MNKRINTVLAISVIILIAEIVTLAIYISNGVKNQHNNQNQSLTVANTNTQNQENKEIDIYSTHGPYDFDNVKQEVSLSISNHRWGVVFENLGKYYVVINSENKGIFNNRVFDFKVTDKFYGFKYSKDGKWHVRINDDDYGPFDDNVKLFISNNYWGIKYYDNTSQHDKAIVNGKYYDNYVSQVSISDSFFGIVYSVKNQKTDMNSFIMLNDKKYGPYPFSWTHLNINNDAWLINYKREVNESVVLFNGKEYSLDLGDTYLENCNIYSSDRWGCKYPGEDNSWYVVMYENGNKKQYGPYGKFADPRERTEFIVTKNGFMLNLGNQLIINNDEIKSKIIKSDISYIQASEQHSGYFYKKGKESYINVDGKNYGPYEYVNNFLLIGDGWGFNYLKNGKAMILINGEINQNAVGNISIDENNYSTGYEKEGKLYVKIGKNKK